VTRFHVEPKRPGCGDGSRHDRLQRIIARAGLPDRAVRPFYALGYVEVVCDDVTAERIRRDPEVAWVDPADGVGGIA
jgi:hypothetical protein